MGLLSITQPKHAGPSGFQKIIAPAATVLGAGVGALAGGVGAAPGAALGAALAGGATGAGIGGAAGGVAKAISAKDPLGGAVSAAGGLSSMGAMQRALAPAAEAIPVLNDAQVPEVVKALQNPMTAMARRLAPVQW